MRAGYGVNKWGGPRKSELSVGYSTDCVYVIVQGRFLLPKEESDGI
jgi:hypothetical protein